MVQLPNVPEFLEICIALFRLGSHPGPRPAGPPRERDRPLVRVDGAVAYVIPDVHHRFDHRTLAAKVRRLSPTLRHVLVAGDPGEFLALVAWMPPRPLCPAQTRARSRSS